MPKGILSFAVGEVLKFKIGPKGQLIGNGFEIKFKMKSKTAPGNVYSNQLKVPTTQSMGKTSDCNLYNGSTGKPTSGSLIFSKEAGSAIKPFRYVVTYTLDTK